MDFDVGKVCQGCHFTVNGVSYAGRPRDHTAMYIAKKVEYLVANLHGHKNCLCFLEEGVDVPESLKQGNAFLFSSNPAYEYALFAQGMEQAIKAQELAAGYTLTEGGYYVGEQVSIGKNAVIEPGALIGHGVVVGEDARIMAGSVIKHATIGNRFLCNENAVIGSPSFTMAEDGAGNKVRIPSLGHVVVGDNVEVGSGSDIAAGCCGDTVLEDYVKLDSLVHIGHEAYLHKNTVITAGVTLAGFVEVFSHAYLGMNASVKNRLAVGSRSLVGMGAVVTKPVEEGAVVVGNPARRRKS